MNESDFRVSGMLAKYGDSSFFLNDHSIFANLEPSGKSLPSSGAPLIAASLAAIALVLYSV
jgi:hypothetical protein